MIGANGAGKSTLLRILATLLRPSAGEVQVLGASLPREAWKVRGRLGYLGHEPLLYRELTVRENLELNARLHRIPDPDARIAALLERAGIARRARGSGAQPVGRHAAAGGDLPRAGPRAGARCCWTSRAPTSTSGAAGVVDELLGPAPGRTRVVVTHEIDAGLAEAHAVLALRADGSVAHAGPAAALPLARRARDRRGAAVRGR